MTTILELLMRYYIFYILHFTFYICINILLYSLDFVLIQPTDQDKSPDAFYISTIQVTQGLFEEIMGINPSHFKGDNLPVESLSWYEAIVFSNRLSIFHYLDPVYELDGCKNPDEWGVIPNHRLSSWQNIQVNSNANGFRMITQKEWDYLYGILENQFQENLEELAWIHTNSDGVTHIVGTKIADSLGLYDFLGNVVEWKQEYGGNIPSHYFRPGFFSESLSFEILRSRDFMQIRCHRGLWPAQRSRRVGLRLVRNKE